MYKLPYSSFVYQSFVIFHIALTSFRSLSRLQLENSVWYIVGLHVNVNTNFYSALAASESGALR